MDGVMAPYRQVSARGLGIAALLDLGDAPPVDRRRIAVLLVARDDAALAPDAQAHVDVKSVLLAGRERANRQTRRFRERGYRRRGRAAGASARQYERHAVFRGSLQKRQ